MRKSQLESTIRDLGMKTTCRFTEAWLKHSDEEKLWHQRNANFFTFRVDQKPSQKSKGGGIMLVIPKHLNPKIIDDLNHMNQEIFERVEVESNFFGKDSQIKKLVNKSSNPKNSLIYFGRLVDKY